MSVYFISPKLTIGESHLAESFFERCIHEIEEHVEIISIKSDGVLSAKATEVNAEDLIIFFNRADQQYKKAFIRLVSKAQVNNATIFPIALSKEQRTPPDTASKSQSFDIEDELYRRCLTEANIETVACSLAREVVAKLQPTLCKSRMHIFISHRRKDGEAIAAEFYKKFVERAESVFRDLVDIRVGEDAQDVIESRLRDSDIVVFLDTPKSGESEWIKKEIEIAFMLNIPIVWVRIGEEEKRISLRLEPADKPHFVINDINFKDGNGNGSIIDEIIHKAFKLTREAAVTVFDKISTIESLATNHNASFVKLDKKNMIYKLSVPRNGFMYKERPLVHIVQFYGRIPKDVDKDHFKPELTNLGYDEHPIHGANYDTAILLTQVSNYKNYEEAVPVFVESFDDYIFNLENHLNPVNITSNDKKGIIISGAFPECEPDFQQYLTNAVYAFSNEIFQRKGIVIFGAHPTFQHLVLSVGKQLLPDKHKNHIHLYISKYYATKGVIKDLSKHSSVIITDSIEDNRDKSLTELRRKMIMDEEAIALICLGGKTNANGHKPGVDEEIKLARERGLPVYIIGSVGGRSSEIASELYLKGCIDKYNELSVEDNKQLMVSMDYRTMANKILRSLGI